jgi:hypothetical protein
MNIDRKHFADRARNFEALSKASLDAGDLYNARLCADYAAQEWAIIGIARDPGPEAVDPFPAKHEPDFSRVYAQELPAA